MDSTSQSLITRDYSWEGSDDDSIEFYANQLPVLGWQNIRQVTNSYQGVNWKIMAANKMIGDRRVSIVVSGQQGLGARYTVSISFEPREWCGFLR
jgi:hypothetical protein